VATDFFNNNQHVKISLITLKVSAVCTVQQYPNVIKFHEAKLRPVSRSVVLKKVWERRFQAFPPHYTPGVG